MIIELPWPPSALLPNAGSPGAWRKKQSAAKAYRADCMIMCRAQGLPRVDDTRLHLTMRFYPPDRRRRDLDNMLASFKQGIDAISETIGVDDHRFGMTLVRAEPTPGGKVVVEIGEAA